MSSIQKNWKADYDECVESIPEDASNSSESSKIWCMRVVKQGFKTDNMMIERLYNGYAKNYTEFGNIS